MTLSSGISGPSAHEMGLGSVGTSAVFPRPLYDFPLFAALKERLRGVQFESLDDFNEGVSAQLKTMQKHGLRNGIPKLQQFWQPFMNRFGEYIKSEK